MYTRRGLNTIQCVSIAAQVSWLLNILHSVEARLDSVRGQGRAKCFKTAVYSKTFHRLNLQSKAYYCRDFPLKHKTRQHSAIHGMQSSRSWDDISHTTSKVSKQIFQILRILKNKPKHFSITNKVTNVHLILIKAGMFGWTAIDDLFRLSKKRN